MLQIHLAPSLEYARLIARQAKAYVVVIASKAPSELLEAALGNVLSHDLAIVEEIAADGYACETFSDVLDAETLIADIGRALEINPSDDLAVTTSLVDPSGALVKKLSFTGNTRLNRLAA